MTSAVKQISFFEVGYDSALRAIFSDRIDVDVTDTPYDQVIDHAAATGRLPSDGIKVGIPSSPRPERNLDILEERSDGTYAYAFRLNAEIKGAHRLQFAPWHPFVAAKLNSETHEEFISTARTHAGENGRWASFVCDIGAVRRSELARRVKAAGLESQATHTPFLLVPFSFNLIDPVVGAAPTLLPPEDFAQVEGRPFVTHGGVHPSAASFLVIRL
jgi:hypothetical protein